MLRIRDLAGDEAAPSCKPAHPVARIKVTTSNPLAGIFARDGMACHHGRALETAQSSKRIRRRGVRSAW